MFIWFKDSLGNVSEPYPIEIPDPGVNEIYAENKSGFYKAGSKIAIIVSLSHPVEVDTSLGFPELILETSKNQFRNASYLSGNGKNRIEFIYPVQPGDDTSNMPEQQLRYQNEDALILNGAVIKSQGSELLIRLPEVGSSNSLSGSSDVFLMKLDSSGTIQ